MTGKKQDYGHMTLEELIDALPVLTPEMEAKLDPRGDWIETPESPESGSTEPETT